MANKRLYVDIHVLQNVPPSCINRDDTGSPKTAEYGGVTRARVSSQAWKKAVRAMFLDIFPQERLGTRSKRIISLLERELEAAGVAEPAKLAKEVLSAGVKLKDDQTGALFFISQAQVRALADLAVRYEQESLGAVPKPEALKALKASPGIDIALFGRMVADEPTLNTDACAQVAHALSTHAVSNEYDYFTAVDDLAPEDNMGAGHLGTVEFNSSTLYRYATVAAHALKDELGEEWVAAVCGFVQAFVLSMPTGKQNTFANRTLPDAVLVTLRHDQPINLVGAFERPVQANQAGYMAASAQRLVDYSQALLADFAGPPALALVTGAALAPLGQRLPFEQLLTSLQAALSQTEQP